MGRWPGHERYFLTLSGLFLLVFTALAFHPYDRSDWALENALVVPVLLLLVLTRRKLPFSRVSYTLLFVFLCLHEVGAHYTYAAVPYDPWFEGLTGRTFNSLVGWQRNNFDRIVHFAFGLLLAYPIREVFVRVAQAKGLWGYYLPLDVTMAFSMVFELFEWAAAEAFGGDLGVAYLGTQGDQWDAHKDMLMATVGAALAMAVTAAINARLQRDFAKEWAESVRVKVRRPLGEDEIQRMLASERRAPKPKRRR